MNVDPGHGRGASRVHVQSHRRQLSLPGKEEVSHAHEGVRGRGQLRREWTAGGDGVQPGRSHHRVLGDSVPKREDGVRVLHHKSVGIALCDHANEDCVHSSGEGPSYEAAVTVREAPV